MIKLTKPKIIDYPDKTPVHASGSFLYNELPSSRRFEELIYSIYRQKIYNDEIWNNLFDDIYLTNESADGGSDCILYKNGRPIGVIQCKKYSKNVDKVNVAKEILKFLLYTIVDKSLMPDPKDFYYYFVVSKGFSRPAVALIENFSEAIFKEAKIEDWFIELKKKYPAALNSLRFESVKSELFEKFRSLKINKLVPEDLDIELAKDYNTKVSVLFFEIRTVTDNSLIDAKTNEILVKINDIPNELLKINLTDKEILQNFDTASIQLKEWRDVLSNVNDSHISRDETVKILNWLSNKLPKEQEPVLMLVGNPGFGKSAILRNAFTELANNKIPVIGIKADRYYPESIENFIELTNLKHPLERLIEVVLKSHNQVVILIDQIDSLSTSVTSRRIYLDVYRQLIDNILAITKDKPDFIKNKVRLVIAIREFDLTYNFEFSFFRKFEKVEVKKLSEAQIGPILEKLNLKIETLSYQLVDIIKVPSYLEIFCKTYNPQTNLNRLNTAMDLMNELWTQATNCTNGQLIKVTLYHIIDTLSSLNQLVVEVRELKNCDAKVLEDLKNRGIVLISEKHLQFFHQTFYDYTFARSFVEKGKSVEQYILSQNQSIYIRPTLKTMITYLRQSEYKKYIQLISTILFSKKYRFHLQLLIIHELGFLQNPKHDEIHLVTTKLIKAKPFVFPFLESAVGQKWFPILVDKHIIDKLIYPQPTKFYRLSWLIKRFSKHCFQPTDIEVNSKVNLWSSIIRKAFHGNRRKTVDYLYQLKKFPNDNGTIQWILIGLHNWDYPLSFKVFEKYADNVKEDWYNRLHVIEDAISYNPAWCIAQLKIVLDAELEFEGNNSSMYEYNVCKIFEKLSIGNKEKFFEFGIESIVQNISKRYHGDVDEEAEYYRHDAIYGSFTLNKEYSHDEENKLIKLIFNDAKELSSINSQVFKNFLLKYHDSKLMTLQIIFCACYSDNPQKYKSYGLKIIKDVLLHAPENRALTYYIQKLLFAVFPYFDKSEKQEVLEIILALKSRSREYYIREENGKKILHSYFGYLSFEYLSSIPREEIHNYPNIKRLFQELQRKYGLAENKESVGPVLQRVSPPLEDRAYKHLTLDDWLKTMLRYNVEYKDRRFGGRRGGISQHSREFAKAVETRPEYFYSFLKEICTTTSVDDEYIVEGLSGLEKANYDPLRFLQLYKLALKNVKGEYALMQVIWQTNYLHKNDLLDEEVFDFLSYQAIYHEHPQKQFNSEQAINEESNTVRGAALAEVIKCYYKKSFADKIFKTVMAGAKDPILSVRLSALNYMAYLVHLHKEKTLQAFLAYTNSQVEEIIYKYSFNTAQYLARYNFEALIPYFKNALAFESEIDHLAIVFAVAWLLEKDGSYELLQQTWERSDKAKSKMIDVAVKNFIDADEPTKQKCYDLFCLFLDNDAKEIVQEYNGAFAHEMQPLHFKEYYQFLNKYHTSKVAKREPHYYFDYLVKCSKQYPIECIDLISRYKEYDKPNPFTGPHYDGSEPVKIVVGALNGLYESETKNLVYINKAMNLFDEMLQDTTYRGSAFDVLSKI